MGGGVREIFVFGDLRIGVGFEQVTLAIIVHPVVEPRIAAQAEMPVDTFREKKDLPLEFR